MAKTIKNRVGLDVGSHAIKIVELSNASDRPVLAGIGLRNIIGSSAKEISGSIKSLCEECKISQREINISVSGPAVIVRFISMPKMRDDELKSAVRYEAEKFIPFDINDCIIDYQILTKDTKDNKLALLLAAVKKEHVGRR